MPSGAGLWGRANFVLTEFSEVHSKGRSTPGSAIRLVEGYLSDLRGGALPSPTRLRPARDSRSLSLARGFRRPRDDLKGEPAGFAISADNHPIAGIQGAREDHAGQLVVHPPLNRTPQGPRPELGVEALFGYQPDCPFGELGLYALGPQAPRRPVEQEASDLAYLLLAEGAEDDHLVYAVDELGAQGVFEDLHHVVLELLEGLITPGVRLYPLCAHVGGHDDHRLLEVHCPALRVCQTSVVEDLQKDIEDVGVSLLYLVQEQDAVGTAPDALGELASLLVANVAGRGPNQAAHSVPLLELAHVDAHHRRLVPEEGLGQGAGELGLADARGAQEHEGADRAVGVRESGPCPADSLGNGRDGLVLSHHPLVQLLLQAHEPLALLLGELGDGDAGGAAHHLRYVVSRHLGDGAAGAVAQPVQLEP